MIFRLDGEAKEYLKAVLEKSHESEYADAIFNAYLSSDVPMLGKANEGGPLDWLKQAIGEENIPLLDSLSEKGYFDHIRLLKEGDYSSNPYYQLLKKVKPTHSKVSFLMDSYLPKQLFLSDERLLFPNDHFADAPAIGYFAEGFSFPALIEDGKTWMSLIPHEISTMDEAINKAHGKVITYGLGLGYYAFMASEKKEVEEVSIVEFDPKIISYFRANLLPLFPHREKIKIVEGDALSFTKKMKAGTYDFLFADLWHNEEDGLKLYLPLKRFEGAARENHYWIETSILVYLRRHLLELMDEESSPEYDPSIYIDKKGESYGDALINALHRHYENKIIKGEGNIRELLSDSSLKRLAAELRLPE